MFSVGQVVCHKAGNPTMKGFSDRPGDLGLMMERGLSVSQGTAT